MNNWVKGLLYALGVFVILGFIGSFSNDPLESGRMVGSYATLILFGCLGLYLGLRMRKKPNKSSNC
jgi:hypothetical protein